MCRSRPRRPALPVGSRHCGSSSSDASRRGRHPHLALEATALLRSRGYELEIELAGTAFPGYEWYTEQLEQRAAQDDLAGAVVFAGYCSPIWDNLIRADIMVAPSLREPFGNAVVEAQYSLRPVVATAALGHTESITDGVTGLLVPAEDVAAMAAAIARLVDEPELAEELAVTARSRGDPAILGRALLPGDRRAVRTSLTSRHGEA